MHYSKRLVILFMYIFLCMLVVKIVNITSHLIFGVCLSGVDIYYYLKFFILVVAMSHGFGKTEI